MRKMTEVRHEKGGGGVLVMRRFLATRVSGGAPFIGTASTNGAFLCDHSVRVWETREQGGSDSRLDRRHVPRLAGKVGESMMRQCLRCLPEHLRDLGRVAR